MAKRKRSRSRVPSVPPNRWTAWSDGTCAGNPGPMGIGGIVRGPDGAIVRQFSERLPGTGTNNIAEWKAFSRAIALAAECGATHLICHADSELVVRQFTGDYAVRQAHLIPLYGEAHREARRIPVLVASRYGHRARFEAIMTSKSQERGMKANGLPPSLKNSTIQIIVQYDPWNAAPGIEGAQMAA